MTSLKRGYYKVFTKNNIFDVISFSHFFNPTQKGVNSITALAIKTKDLQLNVVSKKAAIIGEKN